MNDYPKVSVVISTYNRLDMLDTALDSVFQQDFNDFEVVVMDDGSPDKEGYKALMEKWHATFEGRDVELLPARLEENSGYQCRPKNRAIQILSEGDYIAYLDDDNTWRPDHLSACVTAIEEDFSTDMVYTRLCYHADEKTIRENKAKDQPPLPIGDAIGVHWNPNQLAAKNFIDTSTILHSKGAYWRLCRESGYGWDESLRRFGDWNFVWRWATHGLNAKLVDKVTVDYNWHSGSMQLTRAAVEVPVCLNYSQYQAMRADRNRLLAAS